MQRVHTLIYLICGLLLVACAACDKQIPSSKKIQERPSLFPDYAGATIPFNIAPMNFQLKDPHTAAFALLQTGEQQLRIKEKGGQFSIPQKAWRELLKQARGSSITIQLFALRQEWVAYPPFSLFVAPEPIDTYLAYRLIEPGYELWNQMGIYQRNLEDYIQSPIMENRHSDQNCMNCHSFCMQDPEKMLFHMREKHAGTYLIDGKKIEKLNTKTDQTISPLVYPSWHPSGRYVAFSVNETSQSFHANDRNRIEVFDKQSDVVVYDVERHEIVSTASLRSKQAFETFPTFSPDGKTLYFCTTEAQVPMPLKFDQVKYSLCSIGFDPATRQFSQRVDTLYSAQREGKSVSFPRLSPDGKFLVYTLSRYGNFSIWHKDADLYLLNLSNGTAHALDIANSADTESYHSWSSNSRWLVFSSRRIDGLDTRPFFTYIDAEGNAHKPFLLPQEDTQFYHRLMKSYNIPEFITGKVANRIREIRKIAREEPGISITYHP